MTRIKLCGIMRLCDINIVNELEPEYVGFVFYPKSKRCVTIEQARAFKASLKPSIQAVGVFVDETVELVAELLREGVIDVAQLHGNEDEKYIAKLHSLTNKPIIKAFVMRSKEDLLKAERSMADYVLLDSGMGTGRTIDWEMLKEMHRPYFLAGGLTMENVDEAVITLRPYAVDVSSGIEIQGVKDKRKMEAFVQAVRQVQIR